MLCPYCNSTNVIIKSFYPKEEYICSDCKELLYRYQFNLDVLKPN